MCGLCMWVVTAHTEVIPRPWASCSLLHYPVLPFLPRAAASAEPDGGRQVLRGPRWERKDCALRRSGLSLALKVLVISNQGAPAHSNQLPLGEGHSFWKGWVFWLSTLGPGHTLKRYHK